MKASRFILALIVAAGLTMVGFRHYSKWDDERVSKSEETVSRIIPTRIAGIRWETEHEIKPRLTMTIKEKYIAQKGIRSPNGAPVISVNYKTLEVGETIPLENPDIVFAYVWVSSPKADHYKSSFMDQPFNANFEWFKDTGQTLHGLSYLKYSVVDIDGYPFSELFLKDQKFHNFFLYCGLHKVPEADVCILGKTLEIPNSKLDDSDEVLVVNLYVELDKTRKSDWSEIEQNITKFATNKISVEHQRVPTKLR